MSTSASAFSSSENTVLERGVENTGDDIKLSDVWTTDNRSRCINWINTNNYKNVCLQFPDNFLSFSTKIHDDLNETTESKIFILADTSYGSCCVDEIAASHANADSVIHFGTACQSKTSRLNVLYIFPQMDFTLNNFFHQLQNLPDDIKAKNIKVYFGIEYQHILDDRDVVSQAKEALPYIKEISFEKYLIETKSESNNESVCIYIGKDGQHFFNIAMSITALHWFIYNPQKSVLEETNPLTTSFIRRRYYYIEKCKDAKSLGLVVGTLTADGYLDIVKHIQLMARAHGIRSYILSVGRINPAKLANFMEIDCFVLIGCPFNNIFISKEFYKPIVSTFEAELALNPAWSKKLPEKYVTDFKDLLPSGEFFNEINPNEIPTCDVSLVSGKVRTTNGGGSDDDKNNSGLDGIVERKNFQLMEGKNSSGTNFEDRTWKGLQQALGETEPVKITKGLSGIPIKYSDA